jgi:glycosyltransferase involved in cell wall biosynthesis
MISTAYLTNASPQSGVGHYAEELKKELERGNEVAFTEFNLLDTSLKVNGNIRETITSWPGVLGSKSVNWIRLGRKISRHLNTEDFVHATNQTLSFIKTTKPLVVTVHDIIELLEPQDKKAYVLNKYLLSGIPRAAHILAVSEYTKKTILERFGIPEERVTVTYNGVDTATFHPIENFSETIGCQTLRRELKLADQHPIVLYVGSDHSRKNVVAAVQAFARLKDRLPQAIFLKCGEPGLSAGRETLLQEIDRLHLRDSVRFISNVSNERLNELYNLADVFIFPSRLEGFGLPPLQAMAAGTPVVCSSATSLPEIVGDAALQRVPDDVEGLAQDLLRVVSDKELEGKLIRRGLERATAFSWQQAGEQTLKVYHKMIEK